MLCMGYTCHAHFVGLINYLKIKHIENSKKNLKNGHNTFAACRLLQNFCCFIAG